MIRLGLCCIFREQPITFRQTTAAALIKVERAGQLAKLSQICIENLKSLKKALTWVSAHGIGGFRVLSPIFPRYTHPEVGYTLDELPDGEAIFEQLDVIKSMGQEQNIRLSLHPDQFNVLSSPHEQVVLNTIGELTYQGMVAERIGADVINIHGGGVYGDKQSALKRLIKNFSRLPENVQQRLTLENDDRSYTPEDLLPVCKELQIPLVYDIHHHRCLPDTLSIEEVTELCLQSWKRVEREPYFHISSPRDGYQSTKPQPHADYISFADFPDYWLKCGKDVDISIDVEAKAKELAVLRLLDNLAQSSPTQMEVTAP